jgi:hypothetical protein
MSRELKKQIHNLQREREDLLVLIDTLQTNLRAATSHLSDDDRAKVENVQSFKWSLNWRQDQQ